MTIYVILISFEELAVIIEIILALLLPTSLYRTCGLVLSGLTILAMLIGMIMAFLEIIQSKCNLMHGFFALIFSLAILLSLTWMNICYCFDVYQLSLAFSSKFEIIAGGIITVLFGIFGAGFANQIVENADIGFSIKPYIFSVIYFLVLRFWIFEKLLYDTQKILEFIM